MDISRLLDHHKLTENPFQAEEARHDRIFGRMRDNKYFLHPDFPKILGELSDPSTSVVFGERGAGKTAIRLTIGERVEQYNKENPDKRVLLVAYDDLNPVLDRVVERIKPKRGWFRRSRASIEDLLKEVRLEDHQDAILSLSVTSLVSALVEDDVKQEHRIDLPGEAKNVVDNLPPQMRVNLAALAAVYDQPRAGNVYNRWERLRKMLNLGWRVPGWLPFGSAGVLLAAAAVLAGLYFSMQDVFMLVGAIVAGVIGLGIAAMALINRFSIAGMAKKITREVRVVDRDPAMTREMLASIKAKDRVAQPWPIPGLARSESRYQLTHRLLNLLEHLGYVGMMVLIDRVDEPTLVTGQPERMKAVIWPVFDNKFLQQDRIGFKLLLPIELRHQLHKESPDFFSEARMDKQCMIDRLQWSGPVLFDLCLRRLRACRAEDPEGIELTDLFEPDVTKAMVTDALSQMKQPRDAFKFLYAVIQEHCRQVPDDQARFQIQGALLSQIRDQQANRVNELHRGLAPA